MTDKQPTDDLVRRLRAQHANLKERFGPGPTDPGDSGDRIEQLERELADHEHSAGWLADLVIDRIGGTPDRLAWVARSARYYREALERAESAEQELAQARQRIAQLERDHD